MGRIWIFIFISVFGISIVSLIGVIFLYFKKHFLNRLLHILISLAAGGMIGAAVWHLIPESVEMLNLTATIFFTGIGIALFFILERILHWNHDHSINISSIKIFGPLNLLADLLHNFLDGILIAASFLSGVKVGLVTTLVVLMHEIPQEVGDFGVLVKAGYKPSRALVLNFVSACSAFLGAFVVFFFGSLAENIETYIVPIAAGGFIYLAVIDLFPEIYRKEEDKSQIVSSVFILIGFALVFFLTLFDI